jgi:hypothetical protein
MSDPTVTDAAAKRTAQIAAIHDLAEWLVRNPGVPMPTLSLHLHLQNGYDGTEAENLATVRSVAASLGVGTDEGLDDRTVLRVKVNEHVHYELFAWHKTGRDNELERLRAELAELRAAARPPADPSAFSDLADRLNPEASAVPADALGVPLGHAAEQVPAGLVPAPIAEHYETRGWTGGTPGTSGVECACGLGYGGFDSLTQASDFLAAHIADPGVVPDFS